MPWIRITLTAGAHININWNMASVTKIWIFWKGTDYWDQIELKNIKNNPSTINVFKLPCTLLTGTGKWKNMTQRGFVIFYFRFYQASFLTFVYTISALIGNLFSGYLNVRSNWWKWTKAQFLVTCVRKQIFKTTFECDRTRLACEGKCESCVFD